MLRRRSAVHLLLLLGVLTLLILSQGLFPAKTRADLLESRVARLESENYSLRARLEQLESRLTGATVGIPSAGTPDRSSRSTLSVQDPQFKRLATLAIEQRERMDDLERRLARLEAKSKKSG